jgi:UDP-N-acetyl-D-glucosamine dehydrogenase
VQVISVIGQGYVGLPLSLAAAKSGFKVFGVDVNQNIVNQLNSGTTNIEDVDLVSLKELLKNGSYSATTDFSVVVESSVILICVPTPLQDNRKSDLSYLMSAVKSVGEYLSKGSLVIIESTVAPGTTRSLVVPILEKESGLNVNEFYVAFSPERIDPQNKTWNVKNTPKLVSGLTERASVTAIEFYSKFIDKIVDCNSIEVAEMAKLLENSFRLVNISFINEISITCQKLGIDITDVIKAASTKPYGFMSFYPSIGIGGHCIPVDPIYLAEKAREIGAPTKLIELADEINKKMPSYFVKRSEEKIGGLNGKKVLVLGVSYKPNIADVRETPVEALIVCLKEKGAKVSWHDDLVKEWNGDRSVAISSNFDLAILATPHDYLDLTALGKIPILDTRNSI